MKPTIVLNKTRFIVEVIINAESSADVILEFENCIEGKTDQNV